MHLPQRTLVQACCERISLLSTPTALTKGCRFVNITEEEDFTSRKGAQIAIDALRGPRDAIWFAPPCTGESTWQRLNIVRHPNLLPKLQADRALFIRLFKSFKLVVRNAMAVKAQVLMELPRYCGYWKYPSVEKFLRKHQFDTCAFDGCQYGLTTLDGTQPMHKPWRVL